VVGHLIVIDAGSTTLTPGSRLNIEPITTLGRAPTNTIVLESNFVSTEHTRILYRDRSLWVEDMGSRNGTFVEQRQVNQAVAVSPGSVLQVGDVRFKFAV
jgi:pSer/pThr/pTyr-binding forkhead associated (FHA) protein